MRTSKAREKLIEAARRVMSRDGVETSSIPVIVQEAGVGRGSFYNHFGSKEDLARAVFHEQTLALREELDAVSRATEDMPRAVSFGIRRCLQMAGEDPVWGWFVVHAGSVLDDFNHLMHGVALLGLARGQALGNLSVRDTDATMILLSAAVTALLQARLTGELSEERAYAAVEDILRLAGTEPRLAREISLEPIEELKRKLGVAC
jgi:AcrR family transcriptional regulator